MWKMKIQRRSKEADQTASGTDFARNHSCPVRASGPSARTSIGRVNIVHEQHEQELQLLCRMLMAGLLLLICLCPYTFALTQASPDPT